MSDIFDQLASGNNSPQAQPSSAAPAQQRTTASQPSQAQGGDIFSQLASQSGQQQQPQSQPNNPGAIHINSSDGIGTTIAKGASAVGAGIGDGLLSTANGAANLLHLPHATLQSRQDELEHDNAENPHLNAVGYGGETLMEFLGGDELLKGLSLSQRLLKSAKIAEALEQSPRVMQALQIGANALRSGAVQGTLSTVRSGGDLKAGAKGAAEGAVAGGAMEAASPVIKAALDPVTRGVNAVTGAISDAASRAASAASKRVSVRALQPGLQDSITSAIQDLASEHGVSIPDGTSVRGAAQSVADSLRAKAHGLYQSLDNALGGTRFQSFGDAIENVQQAIRDEVGLDPQRDQQLLKRLEDAKAARDAAVEQVRAKGIDPKTIGQADALHNRAMALNDVSKAVRASTDVHPSALADGADATAATNVRTKPLFNRLQQLSTPNPKYPGAPSRLVQALGKDRAAQLLEDVDAAHLAAQKIAARNAWIKRGATALGLYGIGHEAFNGLHDWLSGQ